MFLLLFPGLLRAATFVDLSKLLLGKWHVNSTTFAANSTSPQSSSFTLIINSTSEKSVLRGTLAPPRDSLASVILSFLGRGFFVANDGDSDAKLGDFEFFHSLIPHMTAVGQWRHDSVFSAEVIRPESLHLAIANHVTLESHFFMLSNEEEAKKSIWFERNPLIVVGAGLIVLRLIRREFRIRREQLTQKKRAEADLARLQKESRDGEADEGEPKEAEDQQVEKTEEEDKCE
jgi:hypothetical protein